MSDGGNIRHRKGTLQTIYKRMSDISKARREVHINISAVANGTSSDSPKGTVATARRKGTLQNVCIKQMRDER